MDRLQKDIIGIIKSALTGEKYELSADFDLAKAAEISKKHKTTAIFYYGTLNCGISQAEPLMQELFMYTCKNIAVSEQQLHEISNIFSAFDNMEIDYMPLKGTLLKKMYPKTEMRSMGDADILIKTEQYSKIKPIMEELGFKEAIENDHELSWKKPSVYIELHKRIIPSYNKDYFAYYGDGWRLAKLQNGTRYSMTDEDQMIYLFTHFAKHYRDAGIGIKHIVDLWVYRNNKLDLDEKYIKTELKKLQLYDFYINILDTLSAWFDGGENTDITDFITDVIFNSGVYGTKQARNSSETLKLSKSNDSLQNVKVRKLFKTFFLPYQYMCIVYPFLNKHPYLLPVMWIVRGVKAVLFKRETIAKNIENLNIYDLEKAEDYRKSLNFVGLDFNFKE